MSNKTQLNVIIQFVWHSLLHYCLIALLDVKYTETLLRIPYLHNTSIKLFSQKENERMIIILYKVFWVHSCFVHHAHVF